MKRNAAPAVLAKRLARTRFRGNDSTSTEGWGKLASLNSAGEPRPEPDQGPDQLPPGQFISDELQSDTRRFLDEVKDVVRRRWEAGLSPRDR